MIAEEKEKSKGDGGIMKEKQYVYKVVKEDPATGKRAKLARKYYSFTPRLKVGGLYTDLGKGFPGCQRVLSVKECWVSSYDWIH